MKRDCHPDCGPIVARVDGCHAHENRDGRCWHEDNDGEGEVDE